MKLLATLLLPVLACAAPTQIRDTVYTAINGALFSGRITISSPDLTTADGRTVQRWEQSFVVSNGTIAVDLEPNDTATPVGASYYVVYRPSRGSAWSERWVVPTSATALKISQVRVATPPTPAVMIQPQQIQSGGAAPGQALLWNGSRYAPGNVATSTSWGGILGNLADQTDLSNSLAGKSPLSHGHLISETTGLQSALDGKVGRTSAGTTRYVEDYCAAAGTYNETCVINTVAAANDGDTLVVSQTFTFGSKVTISGKSNLTFLGAQGGGFALANGANDTLITATCTNCAWIGLRLNGNRQNQTSGNGYGLEFIQGGRQVVSGCLFRGFRGEAIVHDSQFPSSWSSLYLHASLFLDPGASHIWVKARTSGTAVTGNFFDLAAGTPRNWAYLTLASAYWLTVIQNTFKFDYSSPAGYGVALDTAVGDAVVASNGTQGGSFPGGWINYVNGATGTTVATTLVPPSTKTVTQFLPAARCVGGTGSADHVNSTAALTIDCSGSSPMALGGVVLNTTDYLMIPAMVVPRGIDITFTPYVHYKSGSGSNFGAETYWACTDWDQTLLNPTWTEFLSGLNGGTPATDRIYTSSGGTVSAAALSSAGCTGPGTSIFLRVRKHPSANFTGSHVLLGVEVKYTSAMTF